MNDRLKIRQVYASVPYTDEDVDKFNDVHSFVNRAPIHYDVTVGDWKKSMENL